MAPFVETLLDLDAGCERLRARRYGVIETAGGRLVAVHLRPWPKLVSLPEIFPFGPRYHAAGVPDRCLLYYNQPWRMPSFLALKYVVSTTGTSYATFRTALTVLDQIAELKHTDAIVCDARNLRLSDRFLARLGWEPLRPRRWHRNFIRRFYGVYPQKAATGGRGAKPQAALAAVSTANAADLVAAAGDW